MRMDDAADLWKLAIEKGVGVQVAGRTQFAFDNFAVQIGDDQVGGRHGGVIDAAWLDDDQRTGAGSVDTADVAKGVWGQSAASDFAVGEENFFAKRFELHWGFLYGDRCRKRLPKNQSINTPAVRGTHPVGEGPGT